MWEQIKLLTITAVLSAVIWWFADQADRTETTVTAQARIVTEPQSDRVARFANLNTLRLSVSVRGTRKAIRELTASSSNALVEIDWLLPPGAPLGSVSYKTQPVVASAPQFMGLAVVSAYPEEVELEVDRYVTQQVPIRVAAGSYLFVGEPQVDPPVATVRILESHWQQIAADARHLLLPIEDHVKGKPEGRVLNFDVATPAQIGGQPVVPQPQKVNVKLTLRERTAERHIAPVVVKFAVAGELWPAYQPELKDPALQRLEITVVGADEALARLAPQEVLGIIDVTSDDISQSGEYRLKRPVFLLPSGVRLKDEPPLIEFRLKPAGE